MFLIFIYSSHLVYVHAHRAHICLPVISFLEGDEDEDTCTISQDDIADAVDITSGSKVNLFEL